MSLAGYLTKLPFSAEEKLALRQAANEHGETKAVQDALDLAHSERQEIHDAILKSSPELSTKHNAESEIAQAKVALDAAKITGKDRTDPVSYTHLTLPTI